MTMLGRQKTKLKISLFHVPMSIKILTATKYSKKKMHFNIDKINAKMILQSYC